MNMKDGCPDFSQHSQDMQVLLYTHMLDILSGEKDFPVPIQMLEGHDVKSFEAGYKAYEKLLKEHFHRILNQN